MTSEQFQDLDPNEHVPIWIPNEKRMITGRASPKRKNLTKYLTKHMGYEVYCGQNKVEGFQKLERFAIWNSKTQKMITGAAAPVAKNLEVHLRRNPHHIVCYGGNIVPIGAKCTRTIDGRTAIPNEDGWIEGAFDSNLFAPSSGINYFLENHSTSEHRTEFCDIDEFLEQFKV